MWRGESTRRKSDRASRGARKRALRDPEYMSAKLLRRALGEDPLQRAAVHVEAARSLGNVAAAQLVDALDVFPAHTIGRHWMLGRRRLAPVDGEQRIDDVVGIGGLGEIVHHTELHGVQR